MTDWRDGNVKISAEISSSVRAIGQTFTDLGAFVRWWNEHNGIHGESILIMASPPLRRSQMDYPVGMPVEVEWGIQGWIPGEVVGYTTRWVRVRLDWPANPRYHRKISTRDPAGRGIRPR